MTKYISLGNWNKKYLTIIFTIISLILYRLLTGFDFADTYDMRIVEIGKFKGHYFIHYSFLYITVLIISSLVYLINEKINKKAPSNPINQINQRNDSIINQVNSNSLIYNDIYYDETSTYSVIFVLFIIFLYILVEQALTIYKIYFKNCDFWMIELYILAYLNAKMFKIKVYSHQLLAILIGIIPILLKGVILGLTFFDEKNHWDKDDNNHENYKYDTLDPNNNKLKSLLVLYWPILIFALVLYFIIATVRSYVLINIKKFMDLKYISLLKILILYSLTGVIFCSLFAMFTTFFRCGEYLNIKNKKNINDYQCNIKYENNKYIDNYKAYFNKWVNDDTNDIENEIMFLVFGGVSFFAYKYSTILIVRELTPLHKVFVYPIQYFLQKIIISYKFIKNHSKKFIVEQYWIDIVSDIVAFIGFLIYLEIIELNFCKFNYNIRKNIIFRGSNANNFLTDSSAKESSSSNNEENENNSLIE